MIARRPHLVFSVLWLTVTVAALVVGIVGLTVSPWWALGVALSALTLEVVAAVYRTSLRTTLSEVTTFFVRALSKHTDPLRGWNTLVAVQAAIYGRLVYVVIVGFGNDEARYFGLVVGTLFALGQHDHWLDPPRHG